MKKSTKLLIIGVVAAACLCLAVLFLSPSGSIGVIGGADGPTAIFVASP